MILVKFFKWLGGIVLSSFLLSFPVALMIVAVYAILGGGVGYWHVYKLVFWCLIIFEFLSVVVKGWE